MALRRSRAITASAAIVAPGDTDHIRRIAGAYRDWMNSAWPFYDKMAEIHYPANFIGASLSRFTMHVGEVPPESPTAKPEVKTGERSRSNLYRVAEDALAQFSGEQGGHPEMFRLYGLNRTVVASCWLLGVDKPAVTNWEIISTDELQADALSGTMKRIVAPNVPPMDLPAGHHLARFWVRHPRYSLVADGALSALEDDCKRLMALNESLTSRLLSRLSQAGILFLPNTLSIPGMIGQPDGTGNGPQDPFFQKILDTMTRAITERGSAAGSIPIVVRGPSGEGENIVHVTLDRTIEESELTLRAELRNNIAVGMDLPPETQQGLGSGNHWCLPSTERALVRGQGWLDQSEIAAGTEIRVFDHVTGVASWSPVTNVYRADVEAEPVVTVVVSGGRGPKWSITQTPEHRNPVIRNGERMMVKGRDLQVGDVLTVGAPSAGGPADQQTFSDDFVRLLAWYSADGTMTGSEDRPRQIRIAKSWKENPDKTARLMAVLTGVFGPASDEMPAGIGPAWRLERQDRGMAVAVLNAAARDAVLAVVPGKKKVIPTHVVEKFTASQLDLFLDAWLDSDGQRRRSVDPMSGELRQREAERLDALEYAAVLSGRAVRRRSMTNNGFAGPGVMHSLSIGAQRQVVVREVVHATYSGTVWCPETDQGTWLTGGSEGWSHYTGNSTWGVMDSTLRSHLIPMADEFVNGASTVFLRPAIARVMKDRGTPVDPRELERFWIVADPSAVVARPNEAEDGRQLSDRHAISPTYLRAATGVPESAAPTDEEYVRSIGAKMNDPYLATYGLDVADKIDWNKVQSRGAGAPGVGSIPTADRPAGPGDATGAPGQGDGAGGVTKSGPTENGRQPTVPSRA